MKMKVIMPGTGSLSATEAERLWSTGADVILAGTVAGDVCVRSALDHRWVCLTGEGTGINSPSDVRLFRSLPSFAAWLAGNMGVGEPVRPPDTLEWAEARSLWNCVGPKVLGGRVGGSKKVAVYAALGGGSEGWRTLDGDSVSLPPVEVYLFDTPVEFLNWALEVCNA